MKLTTIGLATILAVLIYFSVTPITITAPQNAEPNTLITVTASRPTAFIVTGTTDYIIINNSLILLTGTNDIEIITAGPTKTIIHIATKSPLDSLIAQAPSAGRDQVIKSLRALAQSNEIKTIDELIKLTRINNRSLIEDNWKPWFTQLSSYLNDNYQSANLKEHQELWNKIADQLDGIF